MSRMKIEIPREFAFVVNIPVRITDLNYGGHVGNDSVLSLIHEARVCFLKHWGYDEFNTGGVGLIMSDAIIEFKHELYYGDIIQAHVAVTDISKVSLAMVYLMQTKRKERPITAAIARTGMVCYDYDRKKIVPVPGEVRNKFALASRPTASL